MFSSGSIIRSALIAHGFLSLTFHSGAFTQQQITKFAYSSNTILLSFSNSETSFSIEKSDDQVTFSKWGKILKRKTDDGKLNSGTVNYQFNYNYSKLVLDSNETSQGQKEALVSSANTTITLLIPPIGVGIGRWYYDRLLNELRTRRSDLSQKNSHRYIFLAPDLLACGSTSYPQLLHNSRSTFESEKIKKLPLFVVDDWADQMIDLMKNIEKNVTTGTMHDSKETINWCVVSNGGCVPIALEIGKRYMESSRRKKVDMIDGNISQLILSATPRVESLLGPQDMKKVEKSFKILSGISGKLFWWYSLRNDGAFIQTFSEKNLASKPENLGSNWKSNCVKTAKSFCGKSRYSTFAFLSGSLNGGNEGRFEALKGRMKIDVITGGDKRKNPARRYVE